MQVRQVPLRQELGQSIAALLHGSQQRLFGPGIALGAVGSMRAIEKGALWVMVVGPKKLSGGRKG